jgi:hypothetical protein
LVGCRGGTDGAVLGRSAHLRSPQLHEPT